MLCEIFLYMSVVFRLDIVIKTLLRPRVFKFEIAERQTQKLGKTFFWIHAFVILLYMKFHITAGSGVWVTFFSRSEQCQNQLNSNFLAV